MSRRKSPGLGGLPPAAPGESLPRLQTIVATSPENPAGDPNIRPHPAGEAAGKVIGGGVGVLLAAILVLLLLGPVLWGPVWAGLRTAQFASGPWLPWLAGFAAFAAAAVFQAWLLVQRHPLLRYPIVAVFSLLWVGGLWLELSSPRHDWITTAPTPRMPGPWGWAVIGVGTVLYAGMYLLALNAVGKGRWARRWQLLS
ncbi:hypothetical protein [uncultured Caulobacter sp.]|jgi:hypothetical protein|uniref:hypothetical protein n=1 Tax=uncultured Caulobacter sp. TaxID=158749 RepID=UPI002632D3C4|nr:hypothetical protein [uncultured Caulobacter sp.]